MFTKGQREQLLETLKFELPDSSEDQRREFAKLAEAEALEQAAFSDEPDNSTLTAAFTRMIQGLEDALDAYQLVGTRARILLDQPNKYEDENAFRNELVALKEAAATAGYVMCGEPCSRHRPGCWSEWLVHFLATHWESVFGGPPPATQNEKGFHRVAGEIHELAFGAELNGRRFLAGLRHYRRSRDRVQGSTTALK